MYSQCKDDAQMKLDGEDDEGNEESWAWTPTIWRATEIWAMCYLDGCKNLHNSSTS